MIFLAFESPCTFCLIAGCVAVWSNVAAGKWDHTALNFTLTACIQNNQWYRVFTSPFTHRNVAHIVVNAVALWACLSRIESVYGSWFVLRYTLLLVVGEAITTLVLVRLAVDVYRSRKALAQWFDRTWQRLWNGLSCRAAWTSLSRLTLVSVRSTVLGWGHSLYRHFTQNAGSVPPSSAPPPALVEAEPHSGHPFARVISHPLSLEPVLGLSGVCLAWLVFAVIQASSSSGDSLQPPLASGSGAAAAAMAKVALATTDYSVFGLFGLDPSLAPIVFLFIARLAAPAGLGAETDDRFGGAMALLAQTQSGVRYTLQSMCGFIAGLLLGLDVLTLLPSCYWTSCMLFNCGLICLNSLASNNAALVRRALDADGTASEPLLDSRAARPVSSNLLGLDLAPEMFDQPDVELSVPQWTSAGMGTGTGDGDLENQNDPENWP